MNNPDDILITGVDASGNKKRILVNPDGSLVTTGGGGGGGGGGDATNAGIKTAIETATNLDQLETKLDALATQATASAILSQANALSVILDDTGRIRDNLGYVDDAPASSDEGLGNLIQLVKRLLSVKLPSSLGAKTAANSFPVVLASDSSIGGLNQADTKTAVKEAVQEASNLDQLESTLADILAELRDDVFVTSTLWEDRSAVVAIFYREERIRSQDTGVVSTIYTRLSDNVIVASMPSGVIPVQGSNDRTIEYFKWKAKNAGTGYTAGNWISNTVIFDTDGSGAVLSSTWYNLSTNAAIATPLDADLEDPQDRVVNGIGSPGDTVATSDTGSFSLIAFVKRSLQNWASLLARIPTLVAGRIPIDGSAVTQPVSGTIAAKTVSAISLDSAGSIAITNVRVTIIPANINRRKYLVANIGVNDLFLDFVNTSASTNYSVKIPPGATYVEFTAVYTGDIFLVAATSLSSIATWKEFV
jgi:hypothetical protein